MGMLSLPAAFCVLDQIYSELTAGISAILTPKKRKMKSWYNRMGFNCFEGYIYSLVTESVLGIATDDSHE